MEISIQINGAILKHISSFRLMKMERLADWTLAKQQRNFSWQFTT